jgi:glycosyltransferase involved in cell wall biosynthesis
MLTTMDASEESVGRPESPRVLITSSAAYTLGGMERVMQTLGRELPDHGLHTEVLIPDGHIASEICQWFIEMGSPCERSKLLASLNSPGFKSLVGYARSLRRSRLDLVSIHCPGDHVPQVELLAARLAGLPAVVSIHGSNRLNEVTRKKYLKNKIILSRLCSALIVPSELLLGQQQALGIASEKVRLVRHGVPVADDRLARAEARDRLGLRPDELIVTCFGRLVPDKGIDTLVQAVDLLSDELLARIRVLIGGVGDQQQALQDLVTERSAHAIRFLGHVNDTASYYAASDLFVLPSRHEPFGLVFVEAAQYGVPSIGTNVGGIPEAILAGQTGMLVEPEQPQRLAESITLLSNDAACRTRLGDAARERARSLFSEATMVAGYSEVFFEVLGRPGNDDLRTTSRAHPAL